jgi:2Fe-2S ferredoxin
MPTIHFVESNGTQHAVQADVGQSIMQAAVNNGVPGILADCGGSCSCATCHCYVDAAWVARVPEAESYEIELLTCALDVRPNSRLSCQIKISAEIDGIVLQLPIAQV